MREVLVNRLGGLSLPRKSVVRLTDRPDMTLDVYRGRKTTRQQQQHYSLKKNYFLHPNHFSTNMLNRFKFFAFSFGNSSTGFGIFCLFQ